MTLEEVERHIKDRQGQNGGLGRVEIILYKDSPTPQSEYVATLADWARDLPQKGGTIKVDVTKPDDNAPVW